jgi:hypothetical protein
MCSSCHVVGSRHSGPNCIDPPPMHPEVTGIASSMPALPAPSHMSGYDFFSFHTASGANTNTSPSDHSSEGHR